MPLVADRCVCLRRFEYSETSQILTLFSRAHGILRTIAKGAHRRTKAGASRFDGGVDVLDSGHAVFTHDPSHDLATLTEWKLSDGHLELRKNLRGLYLALFAVELITVLMEEHDPHENAFDQLEGLLISLATAAREEAFLAFALDLLRDTGLIPEFTRCVSCSQPIADRGNAYFVPSRGGAVCQNCETAFPDRFALDARLLRILQQMSIAPSNNSPRRLPRLTRHQTDPLNQLFALQVEHSLGRRLRMRNYVFGTRPAPVAGAAR